MKIGIDPGLSGAIALVDGERAIGVWDMPVTGEGTHRGVCAALLADALANALADAEEATQGQTERVEVVLERVGAMPGQGVSSMFRFGQAVGVVEGVVGALRLPIKRVTPVSWKRHWKLTGKDKDAARSLAIDVYPELAHRMSRKADGGRADALLIAGYGEAN